MVTTSSSWENALSPNAENAENVNLAAEMQKSHSSTMGNHLRGILPWLWVGPKCRKCRKQQPLQQKCRKVIPRPWVVTFEVYFPGFGLALNAENAENDYLCSRNAEKSFLDHG
jgi:hypothetical protein